MVIDEELYRQYLRGDEAGLEALMRKYGNPLTLYINGYLHDVHEAEDLMIEVFSYLFTKKPRIRDQILHICMDELKADYREALYLTYFEGMNYRQAAEVMGKSEKQITNMVYRGKARLRELLEREGITNAK